jgi:hypothetical protein
MFSCLQASVIAAAPFIPRIESVRHIHYEWKYLELNLDLSGFVFDGEYRTRLKLDLDFSLV